MKDLTIEITFEYPEIDGAKFLYWYQGKIIKVINETKSYVKIKWNESTLTKINKQFSVHKLMSGNCNPNKTIKCGWRGYIS